MTREEYAPGLTVDWLNGWLAALGVAVLLPGVRLRWTEDAVPHACFVLREDSEPLAARIAAAMPTREALDELAIARDRDGCAEFTRNVTLDVYRERAELSRVRSDWTLSSTMTDLLAELPKEGPVHSPFDPPMPQGITLWQRVRSCREAMNGVDGIRESLAGRAGRVAGNGLGFDARRLVAGVRPTEPMIDPVVELLAFVGLRLLPTRGNGREVRTRGWNDRATRAGAFRWCAWRPALSLWAIDALLDLAPRAREDERLACRLGIADWYVTVPYRPLGSADVTRAYGARRDS